MGAEASREQAKEGGSQSRDVTLAAEPFPRRCAMRGSGTQAQAVLRRRPRRLALRLSGLRELQVEGALASPLPQTASPSPLSNSRPATPTSPSPRLDTPAAAEEARAMVSGADGIGAGNGGDRREREGGGVEKEQRPPHQHALASQGAAEERGPRGGRSPCSLAATALGSEGAVALGGSEGARTPLRSERGMLSSAQMVFIDPRTALSTHARTATPPTSSHSRFSPLAAPGTSTADQVARATPPILVSPP
eukprot:1087211-Rhodomonas_salina.1